MRGGLHKISNMLELLHELPKVESLDRLSYTVPILLSLSSADYRLGMSMFEYDTASHRYVIKGFLIIIDILSNT